MIISKTPYRISFFGGGTDYPEYYLKYGGSVIGTSIDKYCYITCRYLPPFFDHKYRIVYSKIENVSRLDEINHPSVRAILNYEKINDGMEIHHDGDLPARSGLGTSSAFTVGLLKAINVYKGISVSNYELGLKAIQIEQEIIGEKVGSQDQLLSSIGGFNKIDFKQNGDINVSPINITDEKLKILNDHILMFFSGVLRDSQSVTVDKVKNIKNKINELFKMNEMVNEGLKILENSNQDLNDFGKLLNSSWEIKKKLSHNITNNTLDSIYDCGIANGAIGGKILGAGGGGFMIFFAPPERHQKIINALNHLTKISFKFENTGSMVFNMRKGEY